MVPEPQTSTTDSKEITAETRQSAVAQEQPPAGLPRTAPLIPPSGATGVKVATQEAAPPAAPPLSPPSPPRGGFAASVQRMSLSGRWALGLVLAFLSGAAAVLLLGGIDYAAPFGSYNFIAIAIALVIVAALALVAGFALSSWWAALALVIATAAGGFAGEWVFLQVIRAEFPEVTRGLNAVLDEFPMFAKLYLGPLILFLLAGVGMGKSRGITLSRRRALSAGKARGSRWVAGLALAIAGGYLAEAIIGFATPGDVRSTLSVAFYAIVLAVACLLASWILRSWWGFIVIPVMYAGAAALRPYLLTYQFGGFAAVGDFWRLFGGEFALYIVLPAVVMSAIGAAIGMYRARRGGHSGQRQLYTA